MEIAPFDKSLTKVTIVVFGLISFALYHWIFRKSRQQRQPQQQRQHRHRGDVGAATSGRGGSLSSSAPSSSSSSGGVASTNGNSTAAPHKTAVRLSRVPPHLSATGRDVLRRHAGKSASVLVDGVVAFRHTKASSYESSSISLSKDEQTQNRKDRARVLSRLLEYSASPSNNNNNNTASNGATTKPSTNARTSAAAATTKTASPPPSPPPPKGSTVVITIPAEEIGCDKLRRALYLLATYYNAFVVVAVDGQKLSAAATTTTTRNAVNADANERNEFRNNVLRKLRGEAEAGAATAADGKTTASATTESNETTGATLANDVLPDHRILLSSTVTGRVAFVRQLQKVEFVLDYDEQVQDTLSRFGYRVFLYGGGGGGRTATSFSRQKSGDEDNENDGGPDVQSRLGCELLS